MNALRALASLPGADRRLLLTASGWLLAFRIALWTRPFAEVRSLVDRWSGRSPSAGVAPARVAWAVEHAARIVPGATCLTRALAAEVMLRRTGGRPDLRFGVARDAGDFEAHAWLELGGRVLVGDHGIERYSPLDPRP